MKKITLFALLLALAISPSAFAEGGHGDEDHEEEKAGGHDEGKGDGHGHDEGGEEEEEEGGGGSVEISPESMKEGGIVVEPLTLQNLENELTAPGEVKLNAYLSSKIAPRITAQVVDRHARLGDAVKKGQPLITLSSVEMAEAVGELLVANKEWRRVKKLGPSAVSAKRYNGAKIADTEARGKVMAYGMTLAQVKSFYNSKASSNALGTFQLLAMQEGVIVSDEFIEGELVEPGRVLFNIVSESSLWVESQLSPKQADKVIVGSDARVHVPGNGWLQGKVVQKHHMLDEETRTIGVRIQVDNEEDKLHPGMYVQTKIQTEKGKKYLAVPTEAVLRSPDGDWVVFVEQDERGAFKPVEIEVVKTISDYTVIKGVSEGARIVTYGAFFVQSELAKSGFSVHNH